MDENKSIKVSLEMIKAGREEIINNWLDLLTTEEDSYLWGKMLTAVFLAMSAASTPSVELSEVRG